MGIPPPRKTSESGSEADACLRASRCAVRAAALQFPLGHPAVTSVIAGPMLQIKSGPIFSGSTTTSRRSFGMSSRNGA